MSHDFEHIHSFLLYPNHCGESEFITIDVENEFLVADVVHTVERFLNVGIVLPFGGSNFDYPFVERGFSFSVLDDELFDRSHVQNVQLSTSFLRFSQIERGIAIKISHFERSWFPAFVG